MGYVAFRCGPAISISAPRHSSAGGVSPEKAAQQNFPPGATWHRSPSFFRQKPQLFRHSSDWLYHRQRVSRQRLPPMVPMLRNTGEATVLTASYRTGKSLRISGECSTAARVVSAPISTPSPACWRIPRSSLTPRKSSNIGWREQFLLHRRQQVGAAGNHFHLAVILRHQCDGFIQRLRTEQLEVGQAHSHRPWATRHSYPAAPDRADAASGPCRGTTASRHVREACGGPSGQPTRSFRFASFPSSRAGLPAHAPGVNGASRSRTPTAS